VGATIPSADQCKLAANNLGITYSQQSLSGTWTWTPPGCFVHKGCEQNCHLHFGTGSGTNNGQYRALCKDACSPKEIAYSKMTCENKEADYWSKSKDCTKAILDSDTTKWDSGKGVHTCYPDAACKHDQWIQITIASKVIVTSVDVYYWTGQKGNYQLQYSMDAGATWKTACTMDATTTGINTCPTGFPFSGITLLRVFATATMRLTGMKVFGCEA
jgi:hypothetical protein